uniref:Uncharacterized protein n=1 Tax=Anguilla anguilla TaxID=7936 RepID=A0A0E9V7Y3_ANGAN
MSCFSPFIVAVFYATLLSVFCYSFL